MLARRPYCFLIGREPGDQTSFSFGSKNCRAAARSCSPAHHALPDRPPTISKSVNLDTLPDDPEDTQYSSEERAAVASRSRQDGLGFSWDAMHDQMDRTVDEQEVDAIRRTPVETLGVKSVHDIRAQDGRHDRG